ncbi:MAG: transcription antitermination factor NusB [Pseudomonadota bacterium]
MGNRRKSRELAIQALFFMDLNAHFAEEKLSLFCENFLPSSQLRPFFLNLVRGVSSARTEIDALIERFSNNWKISRMSGVDRNIMRVAVFEMLCCKDIPCKVSINEAIDLGKKFGTEESGAFVNGILDSIRLAMETEDLTIPVYENCEFIPDMPEPDLSGQDSDLEGDEDVPDFSIEPEPEFYPQNDDGSDQQSESQGPAPKQPRRTLIR